MGAATRKQFDSNEMKTKQNTHTHTKQKTLSTFKMSSEKVDVKEETLVEEYKVASESKISVVSATRGSLFGFVLGCFLFFCFEQRELTRGEILVFAFRSGNGFRGQHGR